MPALISPSPQTLLGSRLRVLPGARALEQALLSDMAVLLPPGRLDPRLLATPVRLIVPGRSLKLHLAGALARGRSGALVGLSLATLQAVALEILDRAGLPPPGSASAFDVLVRRFAREEPALARALEPLADGYAAVTVSVRDLVDAGLSPEMAEAADERLESVTPEMATPDELERARAMLRVASRTLEEMGELDIGRAGALYERAREALTTEREAVLPARALAIYGFAELPALALDLLQTLVATIPSVVYVDQPRDPAHAAEPDLGVACTARLVERLASVATLDRSCPSEPPLPRLQIFKAAGATEEAREVVHRVRSLLDRGVAPEEISIVARDLRAYRVPLRAHLRRMGVPFSGVGALSPAGGMGRRIHAMLDLLREREKTSMDRWLDALGPRGRVGQRTVQPRRWRPVRLWDLRLALRALGATRLEDVAAMDMEAVLAGREAWPLPVRRGVWDPGGEPEDAADSEDAESSPDSQGERAVVLSRRTVDGAILRTTVQAATDLIRRFAEWPAHASLQEHRKHLEALLKTELGWDQNYLGMPPVFGALSALEREFPRTFPLRLDEVVLLVARTLYDIGAGPLGGQGGGVAVLSAGEARGRTARHLFVLGLNRDQFPKIIQEDPLLPDAVRRPLRDVLQDLTLRQDAFDSERYLFASLLGSAAHVTLSWQVVDDDNKARPPSPLVERLRWAVGADDIELISPLYAASDRPLAPGRLLPIEDHVLLAALHGTRESWGALLPMAMAEVMGDRAMGLEPVLLARARLSVLDEVDPNRATGEGRARASQLGPYYGFVGGLGKLNDPRLSPMFITTIERMSGCPWQVFLERLLRLEAPPDPMQELPGVDERMVGNVVHLVLQRVVLDALPAGSTPDLAEARTREPVSVPWPEPARLDALIADAALEIMTEAGLGLAGFVRALADRARPYLEAARARDWEASAIDVLGVETEGQITVRDAGGKPRIIRFKADRVDRDARGVLRLTDYKTGRGPSTAKKAETRHGHLLKRVEQGQHLQAVVYALAAEDEGAQGRYLYLKPDLDDGQRESAVGAEEVPFVEAFEEAARTVLSAWDHGSFFPRLVEPTKDEEPPRCKRCEVAQACLRGDSGARGRLDRWATRARGMRDEGVALPGEQQAALSIWTLGVDLPAIETPEKP